MEIKFRSDKEIMAKGPLTNRFWNEGRQNDVFFLPTHPPMKDVTHEQSMKLLRKTNTLALPDFALFGRSHAAESCYFYFD